MVLVFLAFACGTPAEPEPGQAPPVSAPVAPVVAPAPAVAAAPVAADTAPAEAAALSWLALVDGGSYGDSYDQAAAFFRSSLSRDAWVTAVTGARSPLGSAGARVLLSATPMTTLPGAPAGEYVVIQYKTQFANHPDGIETITPMKDPDGTWRVSGYFIK